VRGAPPGSLRITAGLPGGGLFLVEGRASLEPLDLTFKISTLDAPIEPYAPYFPFPARFKGLFSGDSLNTVKIENGKLLAASQGNAYAKQIQIAEPGAEQPALTLERMEIREIDFAWPNYAFVKLVTLSRPEIRVERAADGSINLRRMFTSPPKSSDQDGALENKDEKKEEDKKPASGAGGEDKKKPGLMETMVLDFDRIVVDEGYMRFLDNTTKPPFSQDVGHLALTIRNLSNTRDGRRSTLAMQGIVGGDSALDMRGELSRLGDDFFADLVGELRDFSVASANPYAESMLAWFVKQGKLGLRVHYRIEHDRVVGENEIVVKNLQVAKGPESDEVQKRIGLPLGLIVAVLKDSQGDISFQVPISASLSDRRLDWSETIWSAVKQVLVKALASPFNAIGRLFTGGGAEKEEKVEEVKVDPVTFPPGSSVIGPAMEGHLDRVGEFLRKSPFVNLTLSPVATARDLESLKGQELTAKIQRIQRERGIPNYARAVTAHYREQGIEGPIPPSAEEQLKVLQAREVVPEVRIKEMLDRRASGTRDLLVKGEGIPPERLRPGEARTLPAEPTDGRVEFAISAE